MSRVPPFESGATPGAGSELDEQVEQLEELGDDAIIAQQQGAHAPKPRAQVTEEARSIVISDHPAAGSVSPERQVSPGRTPKRRSERTEKTVVIRDRKQIKDLHRAMARRQPQVAQPPKKGVLLWVIVGLAAFLAGGLVALFATGKDSETPASPAPTASDIALPSAAPAASIEPPSVSIDELPIEGSKKKK